MSYSIKRAKFVLSLHEAQINADLLALFWTATNQALKHQRDLLDVLVDVMCVHLLPDHRRLPAHLCFQYLFEIPFGRYGLDKVSDRLRRLEGRGITHEVNGSEAAALLAAIRAFHKAFARRCATGDLDVDRIAALVEAIQPLSDASR